VDAAGADTYARLAGGFGVGMATVYFCGTVRYRGPPVPETEPGYMSLHRCLEVPTTISSLPQ
jgi:hypothetical protein